MTLLSILQEFCARRGIPSPVSAVSSQDDQILQLIGLANEGLEQMLSGRNWTILQKTAVWVSTNTESQGALTTLAPYGFQAIMPETVYDRTDRLPLYGSTSPQDWEALKALPQSGPFYKFRIEGGLFKTEPPLPAGHTIAFEYTSSWAVQSGTDPSVFKEYFTADTDEFILPAKLMLSWLTWSWKKEKGLRYAEDFRNYEILLANTFGSDGVKRRLNMSGGCNDIRPGIFVPAGNWMVP